MHVNLNIFKLMYLPTSHFLVLDKSASHFKTRQTSFVSRQSHKVCSVAVHNGFYVNACSSSGDGVKLLFMHVEICEAYKTANMKENNR